MKRGPGERGVVPPAPQDRLSGGIAASSLATRHSAPELSYIDALDQPGSRV